MEFHEIPWNGKFDRAGLTTVRHFVITIERRFNNGCQKFRRRMSKVW
jgi:hypothetical protein